MHLCFDYMIASWLEGICYYKHGGVMICVDWWTSCKWWTEQVIITIIIIIVNITFVVVVIITYDNYILIIKRRKVQNSAHRIKLMLASDMYDEITKISQFFLSDSTLLSDH